MEKKYDVFISYSSVDQEVAEGICGYLEGRGLRCFVACRDIPSGKVWGAAIADGIDDSAMMVVVYSQNFNLSGQVDREIELAAEDSKPILTYRISNAPFSGAKKYYLKNINCMDAFPDPRENFGKLYATVCQLLGRTPSTTVVAQPQPEQQHESKPKSNLAWLWILLGVLFLGGVVFGVKSGVEKKRESIAYEQQMEQERMRKKQQFEADSAFFHNCKDVTDYRAYLNKYPDGLNAELAKSKIKKHVADSTAKTQAEAERQRQIAAENERKAREEAEAERQRQIAAENERKAREEAEKFNGHEYADLGLPSGTLWATCNVGASRPEDYGNYYVWGETNTKSTYRWSNYRWCRGSERTQTKYNTKSDCGTVDNRTVLEMSDDAAHVNWGGDWRMPTKAEMEELKAKCTWTWTTHGGKNGYRVAGPNGNSIFLPAAGYYYVDDNDYAGSRGGYWSDSLCTVEPYRAWGLGFDSGRVYRLVNNRDSGQSVRPVCPSQK